MKYIVIGLFIFLTACSWIDEQEKKADAKAEEDKIVREGLIEQARKDTFNATGYGLIEVARREYTNRVFGGETLEEVVYTFNSDGSNIASGNNESLKYLGESPIGGTIVVTNDGDIAMGVTDGTFCNVKEITSNEIITYNLIELREAFDNQSLTVDNCNIKDLELNK